MTDFVWMAAEEVNYPWNLASTFPAFAEWLQARAANHVAWLDDSSKYVDIRFDSRTGNYVVTHEHRGRYLMAMPND